MKKFKIIALALAMVMLLSLFCACEKEEQIKEPENIYELLQGVKTFKTYEYQATISLDFKAKEDAKTEEILDENGNVIGTYETSGINQDIKCEAQLTGQSDANGNATLSIALKTNDAEALIPITAIHIIGEDIYINLKTLYASIPSLLENIMGEEFSEDMIAFDTEYKFSGEYAKLNAKDIVEENTDEEINPNADAYATFINEMLAVCTSFVEKASEDINPAVMSKEGSKFIFAISDKNIEQFVQNLGAVLENNYETIINSLAEKYSAAGEDYADIAKALNELKTAESIEEAKAAFVEMKEFKYEEEVAFDSELSVQLTGKTGERELVCEANLNINKDENNFMKISMNATAKEIAELTITAPASVMTEEEVDAFFEEMFGIGIE